MNYQNILAQRESVRRHSFTLGTLGELYGTNALFSLSGQDDLLSLSMQGGGSRFLDWLMFEGTDEAVLEKDFITWIRGEEASEAGWVSDPCADGDAVEFGDGRFRVTDFGRLRRHSDNNDITVDHLKQSHAQRRLRLDGTPITGDLEFRALLNGEAIRTTLMKLLVTGNASTGGQFDGLQQLVKTGYTDYQTSRVLKTMDSMIIDWNGNDLDGGSGMTWSDGRVTNQAITSTNTLVDALRATYTFAKQRISMSPMLASQGQRPGDCIILTTAQGAEKLMDQYVYWSVYPDATGYASSFDSREARELRDNLSGGLYGQGRIYLYGDEIPIIKHDPGMIVGGNRVDYYMLWRGVGAVQTLYGQYNDMTSVPSKAEKFFVTDNGKFLHWMESDHTCVSQYTELRPRLVMNAPWLNARIQDVYIDTPGGLFSTDPWSGTSFFPETSFIAAS